MWPRLQHPSALQRPIKFDGHCSATSLSLPSNNTSELLEERFISEIKYIRTVRDLTLQVENSAKLRQELSERPVETMQKAAVIAQELPNTLIYWMIGAFIGSALIISLLGTIYLAVVATSPNAGDVVIPDILIATVSGALGALAGALSPQARQAGG